VGRIQSSHALTTMSTPPASATSCPGSSVIVTPELRGTAGGAGGGLQAADGGWSGGGGSVIGGAG